MTEENTKPIEVKTPNLGDSVSFVRYTGKEFVEGDGVVVALFLDPNGRKSCQVAVAPDYGSKVNVELGCIDPTDEVVAAYKAGIEKIKEIETLGNDAVRATVASYNAQVDDVYKSLFGEPMKITPVEIAPQAASEYTEVPHDEEDGKQGSN